MFYNCSSLTNMILENFDTPKLYDISSMFQDCINLLELYLPLFNTKNCKRYTSVFEGCYNLTLKIDGSKFNLRNIVPKYVDIIDITD